MSPEQIGGDPEVVGSEEIHQVGKEHLECGFRPTELLGQLLGYSKFHLLGDLSNIILLRFGNTCVLCQVVSGVSSQLSLLRAASFLFFLRFVIEKADSREDWITFFNFKRKFCVQQKTTN